MRCKMSCKWASQDREQGWRMMVLNSLEDCVFNTTDVSDVTGMLMRLSITWISRESRTPENDTGNSTVKWK